MSEPITLPAPEVSWSPAAESKWEREYRAFLRLLPQLLITHRDRYVAVHDEQAVDSDDDPIALTKRVHARYGYVPIHVDKVTVRPPKAVRIPHYRGYIREGPG